MSPNRAVKEPLKILIVEDNRDARTTMRLLLTMVHGHDVYEAADAASGVQSARELEPDLALVDLGLPDADGCVVARRIREMPGCHATVLVALTGYVSQDDQQRAADAGFDHYLVKPADPAAVAAILEQTARAKADAARAHD